MTEQNYSLLRGLIFMKVLSNVTACAGGERFPTGILGNDVRRR